MNRVLLIDDDEQLGPPLAMYFKRFDLVLEQAFTPSMGLARLQEGNFDAAILDIMLPEMDGFEVCRRIRKDSQVPIIMLTARGELTDRVVGLEMGADDYLPKPFEPRELVARVQTVLRRFRASASGGGADPGGVQPENASVLLFIVFNGCSGIFNPILIDKTQHIYPPNIGIEISNIEVIVPFNILAITTWNWRREII